MGPAVNSDEPENPYAPPQSDADKDKSVPIPWAPLVTIAIGVAISTAWTLYLRWTIPYGMGRRPGWEMMVVTVAVWGIATALLVLRVSWARAACRTLAALMVLDAIPVFTFWGTTIDHVVQSSRFLVFGLAFYLLRRPTKRAA